MSPSGLPRWIEKQLVGRGINDERVLRAFADLPRTHFVPRSLRNMILDDAPIPIGCRQTVSQPFIIALSLQALELTGSERVLDVGTGSGFQAALLSQLAGEVFTIEIHQKLFTAAKMALEQHSGGRVRVHTRMGDGSMGWPENAPYDAIVVGSRAPAIPDSLVEQLAAGGRMVIPVGGEAVQTLYKINKTEEGTLEKKVLERVLFVPLLGQQGSGRFPD